MKLRLPSRLVQALLTTCAAALTSTTASADIPEDYTQVVISCADDLKQYSSSSSKYAFLVEADINAANCMYGSFQYWSSLDLDSKHLLTFSDVSSTARGAIIATDLTMEEFKKLMFSSCVSTSSSYGGGALYNGSTSGTINILRNGSAEFTENKAIFRGGAIYSKSEIVLDFNDSLSFDSNRAELSAHSDATAYGGAIYSTKTLEVKGNRSVTYSENNTYSYSQLSDSSNSSDGGAIYGESNSIITLSDNEILTFRENYAINSTTPYGSSASTSSSSSSSGGAIYGGSDSIITLCDNGSVLIDGNYTSTTTSAANCKTSACGGAIFGSTIELCGNGNMTFSGNYTSSVSTYASTTAYIYASADAFGGAIQGSSIAICNNSSITFSGNSTSSKSSGPGGFPIISYGGAITGRSIELCDNGRVLFSGNSSSATTDYAVGYSGGGAIYIYGGRSIEICCNSCVEFRNNYAFFRSSNNAYGGAIYAVSGCSISIEGNGSVEFRGNYEKYGTGSYTYRLRGLYTNGNSLKLSAGEGQSIAFYDGIYTGAAVTVSYNGKYVDSDGNEHAGTGDILMSGVHAEEDLCALKQDYTQSELDNSRLFEINGTACLYGGRLRVEDQAVYKGAGIDIAADSNAVLRVSNASLVLTDGITVGANAKITGRQSNEISTSDGIDISEPQMRGAEGMGTLSNVNVDIIDDYTIENMSISGSVIDISAGKHLYVKHVNIEADARITDEAAWLDMVDTHGWLDNSNTEASAPVMSLGDTLFYRSGDDAWMRLDHDVSYVALTSELFSNVTMTGSDLWLDLTDLAGTIGDAWAFSIAFKDAFYDVNGLRVVATVDGEHYFDGYYTTKQDGTTTTLYFSSQIPEPATSTLSLLALAALAARRRRKY